MITRLLLLVALLSTAGMASLIQNGGFETGDATFWNVTGTIDVVGTLWIANSGTYSTDLTGTSAGSISQTFATNIGESYIVEFYMAGNPASQGVMTLWASVGPVVNSPYTFDTTGKDRDNMGWTQHSFTFVAQDTTSTLTLASQVPGVYGPAVDDISVNSTVPEPGTSLLAGLAFGALYLLRRRS
jgi:choice-of-anchor C domain-containing protein